MNDINDLNDLVKGRGKISKNHKMYCPSWVTAFLPRHTGITYLLVSLDEVHDDLKKPVTADWDTWSNNGSSYVSNSTILDSPSLCLCSDSLILLAVLYLQMLPWCFLSAIRRWSLEIRYNVIRHDGMRRLHAIVASIESSKYFQETMKSRQWETVLLTSKQVCTLQCEVHRKDTWIIGNRRMGKNRW